MLRNCPNQLQVGRDARVLSPSATIRSRPQLRSSSVHLLSSNSNSLSSSSSSVSNSIVCAALPAHTKTPLRASSPAKDTTLQTSPTPSPVALAATLNGTSAAPASKTVTFDPIQRAQTRKAKLAQLLEIRAIYRNYIRAKTLLGMPFPVYRPGDGAGGDGVADANGGPGRGLHRGVPWKAEGLRSLRPCTCSILLQRAVPAALQLLHTTSQPAR